MIQAIGDIPEKRKDLHKVDRLARSRVKDLFLGLGKTDRLVFGHTHRPFVDGSVANTGSWVSNAQVRNTYLKIENGEMSLLQHNPT